MQTMHYINYIINHEGIVIFTGKKMQVFRFSSCESLVNANRWSGLVVDHPITVRIES